MLLKMNGRKRRGTGKRRLATASQIGLGLGLRLGLPLGSQGQYQAYFLKRRLAIVSQFVLKLANHKAGRVKASVLLFWHGIITIGEAGKIQLSLGSKSERKIQLQHITVLQYDIVRNKCSSKKKLTVVIIANFALAVICHFRSKALTMQGGTRSNFFSCIECNSKKLSDTNN